MRRAGPPDPDRPRASWRVRTSVVLLLVGATAAIYGGVASYGFIYLDDSDYVKQNAHVLGGLTRDGVAWAFTTFEASNWHPLTWISLMLDAQLGGGGPRAFHLTNALLHAWNAALLFLLFERMTAATWRSALVAALFAVHPLHVESVAWIAERKDVLSTALGLLAMHAWLGTVRKPGPARASLATGLFAMSLLAKPMLVSLPVVLLLLDVWPLRRVQAAGWTRLVVEKLPLAALAAASCVVTVIAQAGGGSTRSLAQYPLAGRAANSAVTYVAYLGKAVWPSRLSVFYPYAYAGIPAVKVAASVLFLAAMTYASVRARASRPYLAVGWLWYLVTLVPVIGIVQVGSQAMADRYTYIPLVGPFVIVAWALGETAERARTSAVRPARALVPAIAIVAVLALGTGARRQCASWTDSVALFEHALAVTEDNAPAHSALASALFDRGDLDRALEHCREALRIAPGLAGIRTKLVRCLIAQGNLQEASARASEFAALEPQDADMQVNLGLVAMLGKRNADAVPRFREALRLDPRNELAHLNLGAILLAQGRRDEAVAHLEEAVRLRPGDAMARRALEKARAAGGPFR